MIKKSTCNAGDLGSISGLRRSPGEGNGHPLQYSFLEKSMDRETWWATVHEVAKGTFSHFLIPWANCEGSELHLKTAFKLFLTVRIFVVVVAQEALYILMKV